MKTKSNFSNRTGRRLAELLAEHIVRTEMVANIDECIDELRELICEQSDRKAKAPVSAFIKAEDSRRLHQRMDEQRYYVTINESC